jgi:hypothetical protein
VFLTCQAPGQEVLDYYTSLVPADRRASVRARFRLVVVPDTTPRAIAAKLLDRPDLLQALRDSFGDLPVFIGPWNVTDHEVEVALRLQAPIDGTAPNLWPLGYKSAGRRLFAEAGVPLPVGCEEVRTVEEVVAAIAAVRAARPTAPGVVVKHDNSGAGDGNVVVDLRQVGGGPAAAEQARARVAALPEWYLRDLAAGGVVEELICGVQFASPSVQLDISPSGEVAVLSTHEQLLGGETGQVYVGCRFPANPAYTGDLARHGQAIGERLAARGVVGRLSVDFAAAGDGAGGWQVFALEVNLRKGGTTHPFTVLRNLVPGRYDADAGHWVSADGTARGRTVRLPNRDRCGTAHAVVPGHRRPLWPHRDRTDPRAGDRALPRHQVRHGRSHQPREAWWWVMVRRPTAGMPQNEYARRRPAHPLDASIRLGDHSGNVGVSDAVVVPEQGLEVGQGEFDRVDRIVLVRGRRDVPAVLVGRPVVPQPAIRQVPRWWFRTR